MNEIRDYCTDYGSGSGSSVSLVLISFNEIITSPCQPVEQLRHRLREPVQGVSFEKFAYIVSNFNQSVIRGSSFQARR